MKSSGVEPNNKCPERDLNPCPRMFLDPDNILLISENSKIRDDWPDYTIGAYCGRKNGFDGITT